MKPRVVCDTNVLVSALLFPGGRAVWLRHAWLSERLTPLVSAATVRELMRVLEYPKFRLTPADRAELLGDFLPSAETVELAEPAPRVPACRDPDDRKFLELAIAGRADWLITGDADLLSIGEPVGDCEILTLAIARERLERKS